MRWRKQLCILCILYVGTYIIVLRPTVIHGTKSSQTNRGGLVMTPDQLLRSEFRSYGQEISAAASRVQEMTSVPSVDGLSMDQLLLRRARETCERYNVQFLHLSAIQRKFVTHFRCHKCGLLPLYHIDLLHIKRARCRKCRQLIAFRRSGKYGKLRKEIAAGLMKEIR